MKKIFLSLHKCKEPRDYLVVLKEGSSTKSKAVEFEATGLTAAVRLLMSKAAEEKKKGNTVKVSTKGLSKTEVLRHMGARTSQIKALNRAKSIASKKITVLKKSKIRSNFLESDDSLKTKFAFKELIEGHVDDNMAKVMLSTDKLLEGD